MTTTQADQNEDELGDSVLTLYGTDGTFFIMATDDYDDLASQISWTAQQPNLCQ